MIYLKTKYESLPQNCWRCSESVHAFELKKTFCPHVRIADIYTIKDAEERPENCPLFEEKRNYRDMYNRLLAKYSALIMKYEPEEFKKSIVETMKGICDVLSEEEE